MLTVGKRKRVIGPRGRTSTLGGSLKEKGTIGKSLEEMFEGEEGMPSSCRIARSAMRSLENH